MKTQNKRCHFFDHVRLAMVGLAVKEIELAGVSFRLQNNNLIYSPSTEEWDLLAISRDLALALKDSHKLAKNN